MAIAASASSISLRDPSCCQEAPGFPPVLARAGQSIVSSAAIQINGPIGRAIELEKALVALQRIEKVPLMSDENLAKLNRALLGGIHRCKMELAYTPSYFIRMLSEMGAVKAVRYLVENGTPSEGFTRLAEAGKLDLTVEYLALWPEFEMFFSDIADDARRRLELYGFDVDSHLSAQSAAVKRGENAHGNAGDLRS